MRRALLAKLGVEGEEEGIAADSIGFRLTPASAYYQSRTGRTYRGWVKGPVKIILDHPSEANCGTKHSSKASDASFSSPDS